MTSVFVLANLPFNTDEQRIRDFLKAFGVVKQIVMKRDAYGRFAGLAWVDMSWNGSDSTPTDLQGAEFEGRCLDVLEGSLSLEDLGVRRAW